MFYYVPVNFKVFLWALMSVAVDVTLKRAQKLSLISKVRVVETHGGVKVR